MADGTHIEWTDATWNPITGCAVVSPGCTNCYAMRLAGTRLQHHPSRAGLTKASKAGPVWTGEVRLNAEWLDQPLRWSRPRRIFVCAHSDLFAESVEDAWIDQVFAVMALSPQHVFQVLTKRPKRMRAYFSQPAYVLQDRWYRSVPAGKWAVSIAEAYAAIHPDASNECRILYNRQPAAYPLPNVWLGTSIEDQPRADDRIPDLLETPAAIRWVSAEPLLGRIILPAGLDWVVAGGESGPGARPMHPDWVRALRDQCASMGTAFLFKQWGNWISILDRDGEDPDWRADYSHKYRQLPNKQAWLNNGGGTGFHGERFQIMKHVDKQAAGRMLDGVAHDAFPETRILP